MKRRNQQGYTLVELMLVVAILALITSIATPHVDMILQKANQAKAKGNLGELRSGLSLYYSDNNYWPLDTYPTGTSHLTAGRSLTEALVPKYVRLIPTPRLLDRMSSFNGLSYDYDGRARFKMGQIPPEDVVIWHGPQDYRPGLDIPFVFDNHDGTLYYNNGNLDTRGNYFFSW